RRHAARAVALRADEAPPLADAAALAVRLDLERRRAAARELIVRVAARAVVRVQELVEDAGGARWAVRRPRAVPVAAIAVLVVADQQDVAVRQAERAHAVHR